MGWRLKLVLVGLLAATAPGPTAAQPAIDFTRTDYAVGNHPVAVAIGDLNGDGYADIVTANSGTGSVTTLLGTGTGMFGNRLDLIAESGASAAALGDLDGDGTLDLAVTSISYSSVLVFLGDGTGGFAPAKEFPTDASPLAIAIADLNGDGTLDIVTANRNGHSISVLLGTGGGNLAPATNFPMGQYPYGLAVADLDHDGKPDVVATNYYDNTVSVRRGDGAGGFGPIATFATAARPTSVAIADLNGDGNPDLAVTGSGANSVGVLFGDGGGGFAARTDYPTGVTPITVAIADMNGDGLPDLVVTNRDSKSVSVILASPGGVFTPKVDSPTGTTPWGVAIGLLSGDALPDLAVTNADDGTVSALIQYSETRTPTSTSLVSSPNPSDAAQSVTLTATVSPGAATGTVTFLDGTQTLATATLGGGTATFSIANLTVGSHTLAATYSGDNSYRPSGSPTVVQTVNYLASATTVVSSANPAQILQSVQFTATVAGVAPGAPVPAGSVRFMLDGTNFGSAVTLAGGQATSQATSSLPVGSHTVEALYLGNALFTPSASAPLSQVVQPPLVISGVRDVPNDQGGRVFLTWRCPIDHPGTNVITGYRVWRRDPSPTAAARTRGRATRGRASDALDETFWEAIATLPAQRLVSYAFTAPTTQDSMPDGNPYTAFFVTALTTDPYTFYESVPDSGYSVDNLAPPTPSPFVAVYGPITTALHWGVNPAPDLREFRLYRGLSPDFVPGPANLVVATPDTGYVDPTRTPYVYKLDAVDVHGNASRYALVTPNGPVAVLASVASIIGSPNEIRVTWYAPANPGLDATVYRRSEGTDWKAIATITADPRGYMSYEDTQVTSGQMYGYRLGIMDAGVEVFAGEAWALADVTALALEGVRPNPSVGSDLTVRFSLPSAAPARLELIDVGGRLIASREVGGLGPGSHAVNLAPGPLSPGIYLLRLSQAGLEQVKRAAVIR